MQLLNLPHHLCIDMQTACSIDNQHIKVTFFCRFQGRFGDGSGFLLCCTGKEFCIHLFGKRLQLIDRSRAIDVTADHHHFFLLLFPEKA